MRCPRRLLRQPMRLAIQQLQLGDRLRPVHRRDGLHVGGLRLHARVGRHDLSGKKLRLGEQQLRSEGALWPECERRMRLERRRVQGRRHLLHARQRRDVRGQMQYNRYQQLRRVDELSGGLP